MELTALEFCHFCTNVSACNNLDMENNQRWAVQSKFVPLPQPSAVVDDGFEIEDDFNTLPEPEVDIPEISQEILALTRQISHSSIFVHAASGDSLKLLQALEDAEDCRASDEQPEVQHDVNAALPDGTTALMIAVQEQHLGCVEALIVAKANVNCTRKTDACTPLHAAALHGSASIVSRLIRAKARLESQLTQPGGVTAVFQACRHGHHRALKELLDANANPTCCEVSSGSTPLCLCARAGSETCLKMLLTAKADPNMETVDSSTSLMLATLAGEVCRDYKSNSLSMLVLTATYGVRLGAFASFLPTKQTPVPSAADATALQSYLQVRIMTCCA